MPVPRFGVDQGKVRMIDDASIFMQNATVTRKCKLVLSGIDQLIAVAKAWLSAIGEDRWVRLKMPDGRVWSAPLHPDWSLEDVRDIMGKLLDLKMHTSSLRQDLSRHTPL